MDREAERSGGPVASLVVAARDSQDQLDGLLTCLEAQTVPRSRWEVIVVDDGSPVPLRAAGADATIRLDLPAGAYAARNRGVEVARGSAIAITDADCRPDPTWLETMIGALRSSDMAAGAIRVTVTEKPGRAERIDAARNLDQRSYVRSGFAAFANFACRREVIESVGRFNDRLVSNGDREFCMRAIEAGFSVEYVPEAVVEHAALRGAWALAGRSFRLGRGRAQTVVHGAGPARRRRCNWLPLRSYLPSAVEDGAAYVLVGIPLAGGYALGRAETILGRVRFPLTVTSRSRSAKPLQQLRRDGRTRR